MKSNFFPITLDFEEFGIQRVPYQDGLLAQLRQQYNTTHSFFRRGEFVYISPGTEGAETLGRAVRLNVKEYPEVVSSLIKHIFFRTVKNAHPALQAEFYPFRFAAEKVSFDLAWQKLPESIRGILTYKRITEVQFRDHTDVNGQVLFGALINHRYRWNLDQNCSDLSELGFDLLNREVTGNQSLDFSDGVIAPEITLLGQVIQVSYGKAKIDTSNGPVEYSLTDLHLRNSRENINSFLSWKVGESRAESIIRSIKDLEAQKIKLSVVMNEIRDMIRWLSGLDYRNFDSFSFGISLNNTVIVPGGFSVDEPSFIFDLSKTRVNSTPSTGLNMYGPYSRSIGFSTNSPRVLVIFHQQHTSIFTEFLAKLRDGIPNHQWFGNGMLKKYHLTTIVLTPFCEPVLTGV